MDATTVGTPSNLMALAVLVMLVGAIALDCRRDIRQLVSARNVFLITILAWYMLEEIWAVRIQLGSDLDPADMFRVSHWVHEFQGWCFRWGVSTIGVHRPPTLDLERLFVRSIPGIPAIGCDLQG
jgi:hypothetical protein